DDDESSNDDDDDDDVEKDKEEEEHLALADPSDNAYAGSLPLRNQCKLHHSGPCTVKCRNCKKVGHIIQNYRTPATAKNQRTRTCYECGSLGHYKSECPIVKFHKRMDMIHGRMRASKPKTMQDEIGIATKLINKKIGTLVECQTENKKRTPATAKNQRTRTCYECGSLRNYKSECPIVNFHKHVDMIHGRVRASKPKTMQDAIKVATKLRNKKISTLVECQTENKKRLDNTSKNNQNQQQPNKRQNTGRAYTARHGEKKHYSGAKPLCSKCNFHHDGPCAPKCHKCNRFGHLARDCRSSKNANTANIQKGTGASQKATCYKCRNQGHYKRDYPERKNQNHENQIKSTKAHEVVHAFGEGETKQDLNNIKDEIEA
nr:hypothetical protein [Tanacetum cinerariifolium]